MHLLRRPVLQSCVIIPPGSEWLCCEAVELNIRVDRVHVVANIPSKVPVSTCTGTVKGRTVIKVFKSHPVLKKKPYWGNTFWDRGYFVNTFGIAEDMIRRYVGHQEDEERNQQGFGFDL